MVFKFSTFDLTEDPPNFDLHSPPASRSSTICCRLILLAAVSSKLLHLARSLPVLLCAWSIQLPGLVVGGQENWSNVQWKDAFKGFDFDELKVATNNFSETKKVGEVGYGCMYEGLLGDGSSVAIKRLSRGTSQAWTLHAEVKLGNMICHRNLVRVQGFCLSSKHGEYMLVYNFMANGSLDSLLRGQLPLDWPTRKKIAIGAARGLSHFHDLRMIHRDIKPDNILLDEDFEAHVAYCGMALFMDENIGKAVSKGEPNGEDANFTDCPIGTLYYIDPERFTGRNSVKSDVYGFGVTLLELISNRRAWEITCLDENELGLCAWAHALSENEQLGRLVHTNMPGGYNESEVNRTVHLALLCTQLDPKKRPYMAEAVLSLEGIIGLEKRWEYQTDATTPFGNLNLDSSSSDFTPCHNEEGLYGPR